MDTTRPAERATTTAYLALCPPAVFALSLALLVIARGQAPFDRIPWQLAAMTLAGLAMPFALLTLIWAIDERGRAEPAAPRSMLTPAVLANALTLMLPVALVVTGLAPALFR